MSKPERPSTYVPIVIGDYLKHTTRLTTEQHGCYFLLIMDYWVNGAPPDDDAELARIVHLSLRKWRGLRQTMVAFFVIKDGRWTQDRVEAELLDASKRKERARAGAEAANALRWGKKGSLERQSSDPSSGRTASASTVEEAPNRASSHSGQNEIFENEEGGSAASSTPPRRRMKPIDQMSESEIEELHRAIDNDPLNRGERSA